MTFRWAFFSILFPDGMNRIESRATGATDRNATLDDRRFAERPSK